MRYVLLAGFVWTLAAQPAPPQGSIAGQVVNASTGAPLRKAVVQLIGPPAAAQAGRGPNRQMNQLTDEQGRFQFTGLAPGRYQLSAQRTGFLQQNYGARRYNEPGTPLALTQDQHVTDVAFRLTPQGVIVGRILDEDGDPAADAQIRVLRQVYRSGKRRWEQWNGAASSDIGEFRVAGLDPGRYLLYAVFHSPIPDSGSEEGLPQKPEMIYAGTYYPNAVNEASAAPVPVGPGAEVRGIDIHLARVASYHIRGTINGIPDGRAGTMINLFPNDGTFNMVASTSVQFPGNQFDLRGVPTGQYLLYVRSGGGPSSLIVSQQVSVGSGHLTGLVLTLAPAFDFPGQVSVAESGSTVSVKGVRVIFRMVGPNFASGSLQQSAGDDGRMTFRSFSPGHFTVTVPNVPQGCYVQKIKYGGQEIPEAGLEINSPAPLEVVLSTTAAKISGSVTDKDGKPVSRATVALIPSEAAGQVLSASADENGSFSFDHLRPGAYKLLSWEDVEQGAWEDPEFRKPYDSRTTEIKVGPGEQQNAPLHAIAVDEMTPAR